ncbi:MAG: hypothetical protein GY808_06130 [Gammaproteobacteria bacterium]|nr:hypothetical protein [Gammaproteobacteria bacterium]
MNKLNNFLKIVTTATLCMSFGIQTTAEDTEIYQAEAAAFSTGKPKVLIIFDNSSSMARNNVDVQSESYDPNETYAGSRTSDKLYFSLTDSNRYVLALNNRCSASYTPLNNEGMYQGKVQRSDTETTVSYDGSWKVIITTTYEWTPLGDNDDTRNAAHIDCYDDYYDSNTDNGLGQTAGYPCEDDGDLNHWYCSNKQSGFKWGKKTILYTANYVNWNDTQGTKQKTRLAVAKESVIDIVNSNPGIDFGLEIFNRNSSGDYDGGRIVNEIIENMSTAERESVVSNINGTNPNKDDDFTYTPLCESMYEAYRYFAGLSVQYGAEKHTSDTPNRAQGAEKPPGTYDSPAADCAWSYIILMTDGNPYYDTDANTAIKELTGKTCGDYPSDTDKTLENCMPVLAEYLRSTDVDKEISNGQQRVQTYTIGFTTDQKLLLDTAGDSSRYFLANDAATLIAAFQGAITEISGSNESFTSPAVAVDTFSRTESTNEVFFAMFEPKNSINWKGNIKRLNLKTNESTGVATLEDANGNPAIDNTTGKISSSARTVWSTVNDGDVVTEGGIGALLAARNLTTKPRVLYSNTGASDAFEAFNSTNMDKATFGYTTDDELYDFFTVQDADDFADVINWGRGFDVYDEDADNDTTDTQSWLLSDILHSHPIVVNYGALGSATQSNPEQRLLVGTNGGFFHMFGVDDGQEDWAFFPKELGPILVRRLANATSTDHAYGIDAPPTIYTDDGGDGTINHADGDVAYIYFGLRRGGRNMYALNISNPDSPSFLWKIIGGSGNFAELGQTWSQPVVTTIPGYYDMVDHDNDSATEDIAEYKPVLIFGAGYDTNKDTTGVGTTDSMGRGVFIVDATTGALIRSFSPGTNTTTNIQNTELLHSVPSAVTSFDSNGDEITDRLYFGDTGGNLWRIDMPGNTLHGETDPEGSTASWYVTKLADFNAATAATDRRFFGSPDVVRSKQQVCKEYYPSPDDDKCKIATTINFDSVLIGTGDRTNPNATDVSNQFYMIRDEQTYPYDTGRPSSGDCTTAINADPAVATDFRCYLPLDAADLYNATSNLIQSGNTLQKATAAAALEGQNGWLLDLSVSAGEKSLSRSITLDGSVFFTTYSPNSNVILTTSCSPAAGKGRLYEVDLHNASAKRDFNNDGTLDRSAVIGSLIPATPSPHFGSDGGIRLLFQPSGGELGGNPLDVGAEMPQPYGIYWYREDQ